MPLFFFLSGYCFNEKYVYDKKTFFLHRLKGLYWPFLKYNLVFIALHNLFYHFKIYEKAYSWDDIISKISEVVMMNYTEINLGQYWFLRYLFLSSICFLFLRYVFRKIHYILTCIVIILPLLAILANYYSIPHISAVLMLSLFFYGVGYHSKNFNFEFSVFKFAACIIALAIGSIMVRSVMLNIETQDIIPFSIFAIIGIYATMMLTNKININNNWIRNVLIYMGNNTMPILTWHFIVFDFYSLFYLHFVLHKTFSSVEYEGLYINLRGFHFIIFTILGLIIPLLLNWFFNKVVKFISIVKHTVILYKHRTL